MARRAALLFFLCILFQAHAERSFPDSLQAMAARVSLRIAQHGHARIAVMGIGDAHGDRNALGDLLTAEFTYQLARQAYGFRLVERAELEALLAEHRLTASGLVRQEDAICLGGLASATAIVIGRLTPVDKRHASLELKLVHVESGLLEGMERSVIEVPEGFDGTTLTQPVQRTTAEPVLADRHGPVEIHAGVGHGSFFGRGHPSLRGDLWLRSGHYDAQRQRRVPGRSAIGLRVQLMPEVGGDLPEHADFGHVASLQRDIYAYADPFTGEGPISQGDVYLVPTGDLTYGMQVVMDAVDGGSTTAIWQQAHAISFNAQRWSVLVPVRLYLTPAENERRLKPFVEMGYGADLISTKPMYAVTSISATAEGLGEPVFDMRAYSTNTSFVEGGKTDVLLWNGMIGAGLELGRFSMSASWQRSFHGSVFGSGTDMRRVQGDPIAIALLNGSALDDAQLQAELAQQGAIRFGTTGQEDFMSMNTTARPAMDRFLDRSHVQFTVGVRLF